MRIVHLTSVHPTHDVRIYEKMCVSLAKEGHEVHLVAVGDSESCERDANGVTIHLVPKGRGRLSRIMKTSKRVARKAAELRGDLYHLHDPELLRCACDLQKRASAPVIYDAHEDVRLQVKDKHWIPGVVRGFVSVAIGRYEDRVATKLAGIIAATPAIGRRHERHDNCAVINNYPVCAHRVAGVSDEGASKNQFVYVGIIRMERGICQMVDALSRLSDGACLHLAGGWESADLERKMASSDGWRRVNYHGVVGRSGVNELLMKASAGLVLFQPAPNHMESQPNKLFEYMAMELPVIASRFPLWEKIVGDAKCGILVDPTSPEEVANAMEWVVKNPKEAREMGKRGKDLVKNVCNWEQEFSRLLDFYQKTMKKERLSS